MSSIVLEGVTKVFADGNRVVRGVDLVIDSGEFMVFVGPSGCGKSTLLRMIAGLEEVTAGRILIGDRDVTDLSPRARDIAMVFQNYALYPHMTVRENLGYALKVAKLPKRDIASQVDDVAQMLGLTELLDRKPAALSGGQRQRVAMGRAIVRRPAAYLMDEPLSNLDAKLRVSMRAELSNLHKRMGVTTIYVTHDQIEAMTLGQRVAVINDGVIQQLDTPQNLYAHPANIFVAGFIGSPSMNLVQARVGADGLAFGQYTVPLAEDQASLLGDAEHVVVGMRPDAFQDAAFAEQGLPSIDVEVTVVEELGAEAHVFFPVDSPRIVTESSTAGPEAEDALLAEDADRTRFVARVDPRSRVRLGDRLTLSVDPSRFHFFDPDTGRVLAPAASTATSG